MNFIKTGKNSVKILQDTLAHYNRLSFNPIQRTLLSYNHSLSSISSVKPKFYPNFNERYCLSAKKTDVMIIRCLTKGRDKPKEKKNRSGKPKIVLTDEEMNQLIPINELRLELNNVIQSFKTDLITNINVRSNPQSIDGLIVEIDGSKHCLNEIANISRKSPQLVVINLSSLPDALKPVMKAINESGMNLSPQQEGNVIYLPIPKVTREHREGLAHNTKTLFNKTKEELKHIQSSFSSYVKKQKKSHISEELIFNVNENIRYLIDNKIHECEQIMDQKIKELLN